MKWEVNESLFSRLVNFFIFQGEILSFPTSHKSFFFSLLPFFSFTVRITLSPHQTAPSAYQDDIYCWRAFPVVLRRDNGNLDIANKICTSNVSIKIHSLKLMPIKKCNAGNFFFLLIFTTGTWCWIIRVSSLNGAKSQCARSSTCRRCVAHPLCILYNNEKICVYMYTTRISCMYHCNIY